MAAVFTPLAQPTFDEVCSQFGLGNFKQAQPIAGGSVNTIYRLETTAGNFFLRLEEVKARPELEAELAFVHQLNELGFPTPAPKRCGGGYVMDHDGRCVSLFPEQSGATLSVTQWSLGQFEAVGKLMARLHTLSRQIPGVLHDRFSLNALEVWFDGLKDRLAAGDAAERQLLSDEFSFQKSRLSLVSALPQGVVHGDLFADNVFFEGQRLTGIIDFDAAASRELIYDLATALNALCFRGENLFFPSAAALLRGYQSERLLETSEKAAFVDVWRASSLRFAVTRIKDYELKLAGNSGREYRDYRDFCRRLRWQRGLTPEKFWKEIDTHVATP